MGKYQNKKVNRKKNRTIFLLVLMVGILALLTIFSINANERFFNIALEMTKAQSKFRANKIIDGAVETTIKEMKIKSADLFTNTGGETGVVSANTMLINEFCSVLSDDITEGGMSISKERVTVPLGVMAGVEFLANSGPEIPFVLHPIGTTEVDYETSFDSVGINQVNFKIWINVTMEMKIINPLMSESFILNKKIMLVDTVIRGTVPNQYLNIGDEKSFFKPES